MVAEGKSRWMIEDWAGNRVYPDRTFDTYEDAWEFIREQHPNEDDWQEFEVVRC